MNQPTEFPQQSQELPGEERKMSPEPEVIRKSYKGSGKLNDKTVVITGGDSGIGRSAAVHMAREGADIVIMYLSKDTPMKRAGQPSEVGPAYVFLGSIDSSYMTGQILHINGGEIVGG